MIKSYKSFDPFFTRLNNSSCNTAGDGINPMEGKDQMRAMVAAPGMTSDMSSGACGIQIVSPIISTISTVVLNIRATTSSIWAMEQV